MVRVKLHAGVGTLLLAALVLLCAGGRAHGQHASSGNSAAGNTAPVRIAEGEYRVYRQSGDGGIGPFTPSVHDFAESWTMWRLADSTLEVNGERTYESPEYEHHKDSFSVRLNRQFGVLRITEYAKLRWRPDSGPLTCNFLPRKLECSSGARDPAQEVHLSVPLPAPYGFLWPISVFSLSNVTRFVDRKSAAGIPVDMITVDEPSEANPVVASVLEGRLFYAGQEKITVADRSWLAEKFILKVPLHPPFAIWTSAQGLLLDFTLENNARQLTEHGMKLVRYKQWAVY